MDGMQGHAGLGEFLRTCRAAMAPEGPREGRRVAGMRREEVAQLAGVSVDYYTRLEQGRHTSPSPAVVDALSRVFGLDAAGHAHLADLARPVRGRGKQPPAQKVRPGMQQMIASMGGHPAFIVGRRTDVLASNALARALMTDWPGLPPRERNYTRWVLLDPAARELFVDWRTVAAEVVGTLRLYAGRYPDDARLTELVGELSIKSAEFRGWWNGHRVHERTHGTKRLLHPAVGPITIRYEALALAGDEDQTLFVYDTDPGSVSHDNMRLLALWASGEGTGTNQA